MSGHQAASGRRSIGRVADTLADSLVGDRLRAAVDRRLRSELRGPAVQELIRSEVSRHLKAVGDRDFTAEVLHGARAHTNRTLTRDRYATLSAEIHALTGAKNLDWQLQQAFRSLLDVETRGLGRVAGSSYNILGKLVTPPLLDPPPGPVLEIGTLFGLFSPALIRAFRRNGQFRTLTVIDPFAGLQVQGGANLKPDHSGTPVTEQVARWNYAELGLRDDEVRVVTGLSTEDGPKRSVAEQTYGVVVIDGDHHADGVESDLWWVETITVSGGVVVMDDYGDGKWPGVQAGAERYLAGGGKLQLLGTASTSAYLRMP